MTSLDHIEYDIRWAIDPIAAEAMNTSELRSNFLIDSLFAPDRIILSYTHYDRMIVGSAVPVEADLALEAIPPLGTARFLERRELVAINIGGSGTVVWDGNPFELGPRDMVYLGMGGKEVRFTSASSSDPARFYLVSAPAHATHPSTKVTLSQAKRLDLGSPETSNQRSIFQFVHPDVDIKTCQLVVGMTTFSPGSIWNTMPAHLHDRRMEAYLYFDLPDSARTVHLMGRPQETRHLIIANEQAVVSPSWSIHAGVGTAPYAFIWAMAGDNSDYQDVEPVAVSDLR